MFNVSLDYDRFLIKFIKIANEKGFAIFINLNKKYCNPHSYLID